MIFKTAEESRFTMREVIETAQSNRFDAFEPFCIWSIYKCVTIVENDICSSDHLTTLAYNFLRCSLEFSDACLHLCAFESGSDNLICQYDRSELNQVNAACLGMLLGVEAYLHAETISNLLLDGGTLECALSTMIRAEVGTMPLDDDARRPMQFMSDHQFEVSGTLLDIMPQVGRAKACRFLLQ